jgi:hypothetical protein
MVQFTRLAPTFLRFRRRHLATRMRDRVTLLAASGGSGLAGVAVAAFVFGTGLFPGPDIRPRTGPDIHPATGLDHTHVGLMHSYGSNVPEATFNTEISAVNAHMHESMAVMPSGDSDRDFMLMMIPHHQGAIEMSIVLLKYGRDERLRRLAQSIIVEQGAEIEYMRSLLRSPPSLISEIKQ